MAWGLTAFIGGLFFIERLPMIRRDIFSRLPVIGSYWAAYRVEEAAIEEAEE